MDRGLGIPNSVAAIRAGADRIHACALGIGERVGNTPMDLLLVNLKLLGLLPERINLRRLAEYVKLVSEACRVPIPKNYPVFGDDAFETGTGVHAAAVIKALRRGDTWLANRVYSGVPADDVGLEQVIRIGPMSGKSNVVYWLEKRGLEAKDETVEKIFEAAKVSTRLLTDEEVYEIIQ
jgi:2-isopropylmalate synthase